MAPKIDVVNDSAGDETPSKKKEKDTCGLATSKSRKSSSIIDSDAIEDPPKDLTPRRKKPEKTIKFQS